MADVLSHGGDGGNQPPHQGGNRLHANCESAPLTKRRGPAQCKNLMREWEANGKMPLPILFDLRTLQPLDVRGNYLKRFVGNQVRYFIAPCHESYDLVPQELKAHIQTVVQEYFDIRGFQSPYTLKQMLGGIDRIAADLYRRYKNRVYKWHIKNPGKIYRGVSTKDWEKTLELFRSDKFQARSETNKANRKKQRYPSLQGSKSFAATKFERRDQETMKLPSDIDSFEWFRKRKTGDWVNEAAESDFTKLVEAREMQTQLVGPNGGTVDEDAIMRDVLGERRGHIVGIGPLPKSISRAQLESASTSRSSVAGQTFKLPREMRKKMARSDSYESKVKAYLEQVNDVMWSRLGHKLKLPNFEEDHSEDEDDNEENEYLGDH